MGARRFAANRQLFRLEFRSGILAQPEGGGKAIVRRGRKGMLGRKPVLDADGGKTDAVGDTLQKCVLLIGRAVHPAAAMDVQIDALRNAQGPDDPQGDSPTRSVDA